MCALPAMMGAFGGGAKAAALGGLGGLAVHQLTKKKKPDAKSPAQTFYGANTSGA